MEIQKEASLLEISYRRAVFEGWSFQGEDAQAFMNKEKALEHAESLKSPNCETALIKGVACGLVMWSIGTKPL